VHEASLSQSVIFSSLENGGNDMHVVLGMPSESSMVISEDWYWWLQEGQAARTSASHRARRRFSVSKRRHATFEEVDDTRDLMIRSTLTRKEVS
jgi:hypothetical protein